MAFKQLSILDAALHENSTPPFIQTVMNEGADLGVSLSGGKDSDAMARFVARSHQNKGWNGRLFSLFCDLGRIEWAGTFDHIQKVCGELDLPLVKLLPHRSMIDEWQHRHDTILLKQENKPFWSSSTARYCTKHEKVQTSDQLLRGYSFIVCAVGLRAEESPKRASKPKYQVRSEIITSNLASPSGFLKAEQKLNKIEWKSALGLHCLQRFPEWIGFFTKEAFDALQTVYKSMAANYERWAEFAYQWWKENGRKGRFALTWHPILDWTLEQVWNYNGTSCADVVQRTALYKAGKVRQAIAGFPCHWAYVTGNSRLSCSMCVLASAADIVNGAKHNPWTWIELALMEIVGGWGFQKDRWLAALHGDVLQVSLQKHQKSLSVLYDLNLVERWKSGYVLNLLATTSPEQAIFLQYQAFLGFAQAVSGYWSSLQQAAS